MPFRTVAPDFRRTAFPFVFPAGLSPAFLLRAGVQRFCALPGGFSRLRVRRSFFRGGQTGSVIVNRLPQYAQSDITCRSCRAVDELFRDSQSEAAALHFRAVRECWSKMSWRARLMPRPKSCTKISTLLSRCAAPTMIRAPSGEWWIAFDSRFVTTQAIFSLSMNSFAITRVFDWQSSGKRSGQHPRVAPP